MNLLSIRISGKGSDRLGCQFFRQLTARLTLILFCLAACLNAIGMPSARAKPNIVFILADDLGYGDLSCQNPASRIRTPRLDSLASQGLMFSSAHAPSSLCTPSRYSIMTGQFCWRSRLKSGVLNMWDEPLLPPERVTIASMLRQQGYVTSYFGKWHLGLSWPFVSTVPSGFDTTVTASAIDWTRPVSGGPVDRGFDYFFGINIPNEPPYAFIQNDHVVGVPSIQYSTVGGQQSHWGGPGVPGWDWSQVLPTVVSNATGWLQQYSDQIPAKPFFLFLALPGPHQPVVPTTQFCGSSQAGAYGDYVQELDWSVGQVLDALDADGAGTNTLVIFTSDNGPDEFTYERLRQYGHCSVGELRGIKNDLWEGGHRVPFLARWPGKIAPGTASRQVICHVDLMRTIADLIGAALPPHAAEDSISFLPTLLESGTASARSSLVLESGPGQFGLWTNHWMFIDSSTGDGHNPELEPLWFKQARGYPLTNTSPALLYDLLGDPAEATNLYSSYSSIATELQCVLRKQRAMQTWHGARSDAWTNWANWSMTNSPDGCDLLYSNLTGAANFTQSLASNFSINSLSLDGVEHPVTLLPNGPFTLTISNGINMEGASSDLTLETPLVLPQSQLWTVGSNRTLTVNAPVTPQGSELRICGEGNVIISNAISGAARMVIRTSGFVLLGGENLFSGGTELSGGGFLVASHDQALGTGGLEIPNHSTVQLEPGITLTNSMTIRGFGGVYQNIPRGALTLCHPGDASINGPVMLSAETGVFVRQEGGVLTFGGPISGDASLTVMPGTGTVVFAANNLYRGSTFVEGRLKLSGGDDRLPPATRVRLADLITASLDLDGNNQTVSSLSGGGTRGGTVKLGTARLTLDQQGISTFAASISGQGGLTKTNSGTLNLTGDCSYSGATIVNSGTLLINGALRNSSVQVSSGILGGTGVISGPVIIGTSGELSPGMGLGTLTIQNALSLAAGSVTSFNLDAASQESARIDNLTYVHYSGTLVVRNLAAPGTLRAGQSFQLFNALAATGQFAAIVPAPGPNLAWRFSTADGTLAVIAAPALSVARADGNRLLISWSDSTFHLQAQTNSLSGNWFDVPGGATSPIFVPADLNIRSLFLRLVSP